MKSKKSDFIIIIIFLLFIYGIVAGNLITKDRMFSEMENRMLAKMPDISMKEVLSGKFMEQYETYITDQFVARDTFIYIKSAGERIIGKKENHGVYYGEDGYLAEQMLPFDKTQLSKNITSVKKFLEVTGANVSFALIPGSLEINRDKMPAVIPDVKQNEVIRNIYQELEGLNVTCVDVCKTLLEHKEEELFYRTDHHWTSRGAYYGYQSLFNSKKEEIIPISEYEEVVQSDCFYGTLFSKTGAFWLAPDTISTYVAENGIEVERVDGNGVIKGELYDESWLEKKDKYSMFLGGNQPLAIIRTKQEELPKLLVIRDSYFDSMAPFLTAHYSEIHVVDFRYNRANVEEYMKENEIEEVLIVYSLANFVEDKNIGYVLGNVTK